MKALKYHLILNRNGQIKARKTKYELYEDEIGILLNIKVPDSFLKPRREYIDVKLSIPEIEFPEKQTEVEASVEVKPNTEK